MQRLRELAALTRMRSVLLLREPEALFWTFGFPVVLAMVLGLAFRDRGLEPVRVGVVDAAALLERLAVPGELEVRELAAGEAERALHGGAVDLLVLPGDPPTLRYDPDRVEGDRARLAVERRLAQLAGVALAPVLHDGRTALGTRYIDWVLPGLVGMNLMSTGIWGVGFSMVDLRQRKLLKRFLVTPMHRGSFLLSSVLARLLVLVAEVLVLVLFGTWALEVPQLGGWWLLTAFFVLGGLCFSGFGLLLASRARTVEGVSGIMNLVMLPMWLCSGIFFSYERFPEATHGLIRLLPLTAFNDGMRAVMLEGAGPGAVWPQLLIGSLWTAAAFAAAVRFFRWA